MGEPSRVREDIPADKAIDAIIGYAVQVGATDIHLEPRIDVIVLRYRVDGLLREGHRLPIATHQPLTEHLRRLAGIRSSDNRLPRHGQAKFKVGDQTYNLSVSMVPTLDGQKIVIRLYSEAAQVADLRGLGLWGKVLVELKQALAQPSGLIIVSGPARSGKSTTLASLIAQLNTPHLNIATVEDPVKYRLQGVNQTEIKSLEGISFSTALAGLLAQDPNVIMISDIRDLETAELAIQAAISGRLVFGAMSSARAAACLKRLNDMNVDSPMLASALRLALSQRLARRLCRHCAQAFKPNSTVLRRLETAFGLKSTWHSSIHELERQALADGVGSAYSDLSTTPRSINRLWQAHPDGCEKCNYSGYRDRIGIFEVLINAPAVAKDIAARADSATLERSAVDSGMLSLKLDGLVKALRGETDFDEVMRVAA